MITKSCTADKSSNTITKFICQKFYYGSQFFIIHFPLNFSFFLQQNVSVFYESQKYIYDFFSNEKGTTKLFYSSVTERRGFDELHASTLDRRLTALSNISNVIFFPFSHSPRSGRRLQYVYDRHHSNSIVSTRTLLQLV